MHNKTIKGTGYLRRTAIFVLSMLLWLGGVSVEFAQTRSTNLLLPEFQFHRKGEYDTVALWDRMIDSCCSFLALIRCNTNYL